MITYTQILTHLTVFLVGIFIGVKIKSKTDLFSENTMRNLIAIIVVGIWAYRLYIASGDPTVQLTVWESLIMAIVAGAFFKPDKGVVEIIKSKFSINKVNEEDSKS